MSHPREQDAFEDLPILGELRQRLAHEFESRSSPRALTAPRWRRRQIRLASALAGIAILTGTATAAVVSLFGGEPPFAPGAVVLARGQGPDGAHYELAVAASRCPGWVRLELRSTTGSSSGGCGEPLSRTLHPRVFGAYGGREWEEMEGTVSSAAHSVRVLIAGGGSFTALVHRIPASIAKGAGAFVLFANRSIAHALAFQSLAADGRVLASGPPPSDGFSHPVIGLAPGVLTIARGRTPHGTPFEITLQRIRFLGKTHLCVSEKPDGNEECPSYPIGKGAPVFLAGTAEGSCPTPRHELLAGLLLDPGLTAWLKTPARTYELEHATVPSRLRVPGGIFYGIITRRPAELVIRDRHGALVYRRPILSSASAGTCGGSTRPPRTGAQAPRRVTK
jgi:hypothetical protein